jgi:cell division protein ZapD
LKSEILKELDRDTKALQRIADNQSIDTNKLSGILAQLSQTSKRLYATSGKIGLQLMESDLFQSVAQRSSIPGGTCSFDLPEYHYWLQQDESKRAKDLQQWSVPFADLRAAIDLVLTFIRSSAIPTQEVATAGFFQIALDHNQPHQLLKVSVAKSVPCFAEISGGKHRCTVRFMLPSSDNARPAQSPNDIAFSLTCCVF